MKFPHHSSHLTHNIIKMSEEIVDIVLSLAGDHLFPLLEEAFNIISGVPKEIVDMNDDLESIEDFINKNHRISDDAEEDKIKVMMKQLRVAYFHIEDVIDEYIMIFKKQAPAKIFKFFILHFQIAYKIYGIKSQMSDIDCAYEINHVYRIPSSSEKGSSSSAANRKDTKLYNLKEAPRSINKYDLVGIKKPRNKLIDWLVKGREQLTVVLVVGMRGVGKTTLAKIVFDNPKVLQFDCRLWIKQSRPYDVEKLLRDILFQIYKQRKYSSQSLDDMDREPFVDKVRNSLQGKRYVVVFDDVSNTSFWSEIKSAFPDNQNGSRILITTTNMDVAVNCKRSLCVEVHEMQPLTLAKSSMLLNKMAFRDLQGNCPEKLKDICLEIVKKCRGLPLAIMAIGDVLSSTKDRSIHVWHRFSENIYSEMIRSGWLSGITQILCSTFDDLPFNIKQCLLYFAIFPEDYEVKSKRLIRQWIAEGFIKRKHGRTLEEVAEEYLKELIQRCLVQISSVSIDGKVEGVRIHNLYLMTLREKASDFRFCEFVTNHDKSLHGIIRRLSIATTTLNDVIEHIESSHVRSLFFFQEEEVPENLVRKIPTKYKLLKVLDFENGISLVVPENIGDLIHLKYLSFRNTEIQSLPKSIGKLQNLETLDLRRTSVNEIPKEISMFSQLRHLLGNTMSLSQLKGGLGGMESLQTLSEVKIDEDGEELITELGKLTQLRKLHLSDVREEHGTALCSSINQMHYMEKLYIETKSKDVPIDLSSLSHTCIPMLHKLRLRAKLNNLPRWIPKLMKLVELSLSCSWLTDDPLESLKDLPNLLVFNLAVDSYNGKLLHFQCGGFRKLKELDLRYLSNLESIIIEEGALISLKELTFMNIPNLKTEPSGTKHLANLEVLNTYFMPTEFEKIIAPFAKLIKEKSLEYEKRRY